MYFWNFRCFRLFNSNIHGLDLSACQHTANQSLCCHVPPRHLHPCIACSTMTTILRLIMKIMDSTLARVSILLIYCHPVMRRPATPAPGIACIDCGFRGGRPVNTTQCSMIMWCMLLPFCLHYCCSCGHHRCCCFYCWSCCCRLTSLKLP